MRSVLDGVLVPGSKENELLGLVDKLLAKTIKEYFQKQEKRRLNVAITNDTICLLLSGLNQFSWKNLACGIVGTGCNFALFSKKNER